MIIKLIGKKLCSPNWLFKKQKKKNEKLKKKRTVSHFYIINTSK